MTELAALLFDVDGTLANTEYAHLSAFNLAFKEAGLEWQWSVNLYIKLLAITGGRERIRYYIENYISDFDLSMPLSVFIDELHQEKTRYYVHQVNQGAIQLRPGVERIIKQARNEELRLAIATTTSPENVNALLISTLGKEAVEWFEIIGAGNIVAKKKPAPDIYNYVLGRMDLAPTACIAIEDSGPGITSACAARVPVIATMNEFTSLHNFSGAALLTDNLGELHLPCRVKFGNMHGKSYLDLELIRKIHADVERDRNIVGITC